MVHLKMAGNGRDKELFRRAAEQDGQHGPIVSAVAARHGRKRDVVTLSEVDSRRSPKQYRGGSDMEPRFPSYTTERLEQLLQAHRDKEIVMDSKLVLAIKSEIAARKAGLSKPRITPQVMWN